MHMTQGKYAGEEMSTIPSSYLNWMLKGETGFAADPETNIIDEAWLVLRERADGTMPMPWGKHRGTPIKDLPDEYLAWLLVGSDARSITPQGLRRGAVRCRDPALPRCRVPTGHRQSKERSRESDEPNTVGVNRNSPSRTAGRRIAPRSFTPTRRWP